jgi:hypothetical protein
VELPTSTCHGILYLRYYGLIGTSSCKPPGGSRGVVQLSPRVWKGCQQLGTRDWYLMHYSNPSRTGGQKHTHTLFTVPVLQMFIETRCGTSLGGYIRVAKHTMSNILKIRMMSGVVQLVRSPTVGSLPARLNKMRTKSAAAVSSVATLVSSTGAPTDLGAPTNSCLSSTPKLPALWIHG